MSWPRKRTSPSARAPATVSCIRLRQRSSVDLPHPDGPMIAVTSLVATANVTSRTTRAAAKYASRPATSIAGTIGRDGSIATESEAASGREASGEADEEDEAEEDDGARPGLRVPAVVR